MVKRRRIAAFPPQDEDTNDFDSFFLSSPQPHASHPEKPIQRNAANARERARMRVLSKAFTRLKTSLPWVPPDTKLSKLDTLRLATTYIAHLRKVLKNDDGEPSPPASSHGKKSAHAHTFAWPFTINSRLSNSGEPVPAINSLQAEVAECAPEANMSYSSYPPCEYMALSYTDQNRREVVEQFLH